MVYSLFLAYEIRNISLIIDFLFSGIQILDGRFLSSILSTIRLV